MPHSMVKSLELLDAGYHDLAHDFFWVYFCISAIIRKHREIKCLPAFPRIRTSQLCQSEPLSCYPYFYFVYCVTSADFGTPHEVMQLQIKKV